MITVDDGQYVAFNFALAGARSSEARSIFKGPDDEFIRTVHFEIQVPRIIRLLAYDRIPRQKVKFNRRNIFARDGNRCQYCGRKFATSELSLDHVIPRSQGGRATWENIVCACLKCNVRKGAEHRARPACNSIREPAEPRTSPTRSASSFPTASIEAGRRSWTTLTGRSSWNDRALWQRRQPHAPALWTYRACDGWTIRDTSRWQRDTQSCMLEDGPEHPLKRTARSHLCRCAKEPTMPRTEQTATAQRLHPDRTARGDCHNWRAGGTCCSPPYSRPVRRPTVRSARAISSSSASPLSNITMCSTPSLGMVLHGANRRLARATFLPTPTGQTVLDSLPILHVGPASQSLQQARANQPLQRAEFPVAAFEYRQLHRRAPDPGYLRMPIEPSLHTTTTQTRQRRQQLGLRTTGATWPAE